MHRHPFSAHPMFPRNLGAQSAARILLALSLLGLMAQPACLFRRNKGVDIAELPPPVRMTYLPFNIPEENADLRWISLAAPVIMAETAAAAPDLERVPFWESMPATIQTLGPSRRVTPEIAEFMAARMTARWAGMGDIMTEEKETILRVDFIPSRSATIPFRYQRQTTLQNMERQFAVAFEQFLRYLIVRPLENEKIRVLDEQTLREIALALDVEYGWFVPAKPGEAQKTVEKLAVSNIELARLLFSPTLYPLLAK